MRLNHRRQTVGATNAVPPQRLMTEISSERNYLIDISIE
jgi:hypothetical protein